MKKMMAVALAVVTAASMCTVAMAIPARSKSAEIEITADASKITANFTPASKTITIGKNDKTTFTLDTRLAFTGGNGGTAGTVRYIVEADTGNPGLVKVRNVQAAKHSEPLARVAAQYLIKNLV